MDSSLKVLGDLDAGITNLLVLETVDSQFFHEIIRGKLLELSKHISDFKKETGVKFTKR